MSSKMGRRQPLHNETFPMMYTVRVQRATAMVKVIGVLSALSYLKVLCRQIISLNIIITN